MRPWRSHSDRCSLTRAPTGEPSYFRYNHSMLRSMASSLVVGYRIPHLRAWDSCDTPGLDHLGADLVAITGSPDSWHRLVVHAPLRGEFRQKPPSLARVYRRA